MSAEALFWLAAKAIAIAALPLAYVWLSRDSHKLRKLAWVTAFLTLDLIMVGGFTRLTDSGLGCPDWPGCYGHSNPLSAGEYIRAAETAQPTGPVTMTKAWIEMAHRYFAMAVGFLIIVLMVMAWRRWRRTPERRVVEDLVVRVEAWIRCVDRIERRARVVDRAQGTGADRGGDRRGIGAVHALSPPSTLGTAMKSPSRAGAFIRTWSTVSVGPGSSSSRRLTASSGCAIGSTDDVSTWPSRAMCESTEASCVRYDSMVASSRCSRARRATCATSFELRLVDGSAMGLGV